MIKILKALSKKINEITISILLILIYFPIMGVAYILYRLFKTRQKNTNSFFVEYKTAPSEINYTSPY